MTAVVVGIGPLIARAGGTGHGIDAIGVEAVALGGREVDVLGVVLCARPHPVGVELPAVGEGAAPRHVQRHVSRRAAALRRGDPTIPRRGGVVGARRITRAGERTRAEARHRVGGGEPARYRIEIRHPRQVVRLAPHHVGTERPRAAELTLIAQRGLPAHRLIEPQGKGAEDLARHRLHVGIGDVGGQWPGAEDGSACPAEGEHRVAGGPELNGVGVDRIGQLAGIAAHTAAHHLTLGARPVE